MSLSVMHFTFGCVFLILCGTAYSDPICRVAYKAADCKGDVMSYHPMTAGGCQMYAEKAGPTAGLYYDVAGKGFCKDKECTDCQVPNAKKTPGPVVYDTQCRSQDFVGLAAGVKAPSWKFTKGECPKAEALVWKKILDDNTTCTKKGRLYGDCTPKCDSAQYCIDFCVKNFPGTSHVDYWPTSHLSCAKLSKPRCWCNCYNHPGNCTSASGTIRDVSKKTVGAEGGGVETYERVSGTSANLTHTHTHTHT